jgi:hypothetical protein
VATGVGAAPGLGRLPILILGPGRSGRGPLLMFNRALKCRVHYVLQCVTINIIVKTI